MEWTAWSRGRPDTRRQSAVPMAGEDELPCGTPAFRLAEGTGGRVALEVAVGGDVVAVDVATAFSEPVLGGLRGGRAEEGWTVVWGCLPPEGTTVAVEFGRGAAPVAQAGPFWYARVRGRFARVRVRVGPGVHRWRPAVWRGIADGGTLREPPASTSEDG